jgi:hypothetical protein
MVAGLAAHTRGCNRWCFARWLPARRVCPCAPTPVLRMNKQLWIANICGGIGLVVAIAEWIAPVFAIEVIIANVAGGIGGASGPDVG